MYHAAGHVHPPGHTMRARAVADTMDNLILVAKQVAMESSDKVCELHAPGFEHPLLKFCAYCNIHRKLIRLFTTMEAILEIIVH